MQIFVFFLICAQRLSCIDEEEYEAALRDLRLETVGSSWHKDYRDIKVNL